MISVKLSNKALISFLSNLNAILLIVGYTFFTSLIFSLKSGVDESEIRIYSIVYRAFALLVSLLVIVANLKTPILQSKKIILYFSLWFLFCIRIVYDLYLRPPEISDSHTAYITQFVFGAVLLPVVALVLSYKYLKLEIIFKIIILILCFVVGKGIVLSFGVDLPRWGRAQMNVAQSTLTFGSYGGVLCLSSYVKLREFGICFRKKIIYIIIFCLGVYAISIAGSRGPLFGLVITMLVPVFANNIIKFLKSLLILLLGIILFGGLIADLAEYISPVIYDRTYQTVVNFSLGGREPIFKAAWEQFVNNPILGDWILLDRTDRTSFAHNAFLQTAMSLGVFGLVLIIYVYVMLFKCSLRLIETRSVYSFWGYLTLFYMVYSLTTGGIIYLKPDFNFAFVILLIMTSKNTEQYKIIFLNEVKSENRF